MGCEASVSSRADPEDGPGADAAAPGDGGAGGDGGPGSEEVSCERAPLPDASERAAWRYGGGAGYPDIVHPACADARATGLDELQSALADTQPGDVVYVPNEAAIDLTGESLCVPEGVTLASSRGQDGSPGALFYTTEMSRTPILRACGDDVRFTGIRVRGEDPSQCPPEWPDECEGDAGPSDPNCRDCMPRTVGIEARNIDRVEVDNTEISGWSHAGIVVRASEDNHVHHSFIHHTQRQGLGYGVVLYGDADEPTSVLVERNRFDYNRHAIAASGELVQDYEALDNLVLPHANGHIFDVHGQDENTDDGTPWAGGETLVHGNTILPPDELAVVVRGEPYEGAWVWGNCLARESADDAFLQRFHFGSFFIDESPQGPAQNTYGQEPADCASIGFCAEAGGAGPRQPLARSTVGLNSLALGDFSGDGRTDVFRATGDEWLWLPGGEGSWQELNVSDVPRASLRFGDFSGDGRTDVFRATGSEWRYSAGGAEPWQTLREAEQTADELVFGDFSGDGRTDALFANGSNWFVSAGASEPFSELNTSSVGTSDMAVGDFNGDGRDDIFTTTSGGQWQYSAGAAEPWETLNESGVDVSNLGFADLSGDGKTDVIRVSRDRRMVSWGGTSSWEVIAHRSEPLSELRFGDLTGDGRDDVFRARCQ